MLRQLRLCRRFDTLSIFECRPSIGQRSIPACNYRRVLSDSPAATAAANAKQDPRWVMLNCDGFRANGGSFVADTKTVADYRTSTGQRLRVSLGCAAPPASSFLYYDFPDRVPGEDDDYDYYMGVVAAHTDSVLFQMGKRTHGHYASAADSEEEEEDDDFDGHFVYRAAGAAVRQPSLSLLPARDFLTKTESNYAKHQVRPLFRPGLYMGSTGLLLRGEGDDDLLVVQMELWYDRDARQDMAEFCVLRPGTGMPQWELMEPVPIALPDDGDKVLLQSGEAVIPVGDRYLCWVDYETGFFLCDMADEASPKVRYVLRPAEVSHRRHDECDDDISPMKHSMKMGAVGASKVSFVTVDPRCCCGGAGRSTCAHSRFAFTVRTWTMDLSMDEPLAWVKDGEIDCEAIWALPGYEGLPRANLQCPVVCSDNPNVVCFLVCNRHFSTYNDWKIWMIKLNIKSKTLLSVVQFTSHYSMAFDHLPAQLKY